MYIAPADRCCVLDPVSSVTEPPAAADAARDGRHGSRAGRQQMETEEVRVLEHRHKHTFYFSLSLSLSHLRAHTHTHRLPAAFCMFDISCFLADFAIIFVWCISPLPVCRDHRGCVVFLWQPCLSPGTKGCLPLSCKHGLGRPAPSLVLNKAS